jgi:ABC-type polysaccharide/polyol phosphate export permease
MKELAEILRYRELLKNLVLTELKLRYRRSLLGFVWTMLNPLLMMLVLTLVFSTIFRFAIEDYTVFLLSTLLPWMFFSQAITLSLMSFISKGSLLHKVYFPRAVIPLSAVFSNLLNFLLALIPLAVLMLVAERSFTLALFYLPVALVALTLFTIGLSFVFSTLNVFFRDFTHMTEVLLSLLYFATPIIYPLDAVPQNYQAVLKMNPLLYLLDGFRDPVYYGRLPSAESIGFAFLAGFGALVLGWMVFRANQASLVFRV